MLVPRLGVNCRRGEDPDFGMMHLANLGGRDENLDRFSGAQCSDFE